MKTSMMTFIITVLFCFGHLKAHLYSVRYLPELSVFILTIFLHIVWKLTVMVWMLHYHQAKWGQRRTVSSAIPKHKKTSWKMLEHFYDFTSPCHRDRHLEQSAGQQSDGSQVSWKAVNKNWRSVWKQRVWAQSKSPNKQWQCCWQLGAPSSGNFDANWHGNNNGSKYII